MMSYNPKAVLFDLDGTLIDTAPDFIRIIKLLATKHDLIVPSDSAIREQVSAGARAMVKLLFGLDIPDDDPTLLAYRQAFLDAYEMDICVDSQVFDGLDELLAFLETHHIAWGIVTNKPRYLSEQLLEKLALSDRCSILICPDDVKNAKPDPESLLLACQKLSISPNECIYIGDHQRDIIAGNAANMTTIIAEYGYLSQNDKNNLDNWRADFIAKTPSELTQLIKTLTRTV